jgi:AcrR family transcriptional regulator
MPGGIPAITAVCGRFRGLSGVLLSRAMAQRGAYAPGRLRREEILRAASDIFAEHGYRGASLALIAERVGMSTPGLLHHFPTKEHLLIDLLALRHEQDSERVEKLSTAHGGRILDALVALAAKNAKTPGLVRLFTVLAAESVDDGHPGHEWFVDRYRSTRRRLVELLVDEQRRGLIREGVDPEMTAAQILAMFDGVQLQWLLEPEAVDLVATLADYLRDLQARLAPAES